jgi:RNA recognition motif-containing protein
MSKKLYVKNLSYAVTENELSRHFSTVGKVLYTKVLRDRETNMSRGSGFVEMSTEQEAQAAMGLSGGELLNRVIYVEEARPQVDRSERPVRQPVRQFEQYEQPKMTMHEPAYGDWQSADRPSRRKRFDKRRERTWE